MTKRLFASLMALFVFAWASINFATAQAEGNTERIVYVSRQGGVNQIYIIDAKGGTSQKLTSGPSDKYSPSPSPDGRKIAYAVEGSNGKKQIYIMNIDGTNPHNISQNELDEKYPSWSPDGTKITFCSTRGGDKDEDGDPIHQIWTMSIDGSNPVHLTFGDRSDFAPIYSPDGQHIAFMSLRVNIITTEGRKVYTSWRPHIFVMQSDGQNQRRLTPLVSSLVHRQPHFSPDSTHIAYYVKPTSDHEDIAWSHIYITDVDGNKAERLSPLHKRDESPRFSPDGTKITFESWVEGTWQIFVMNTDGTNRRQVTYGSASSFHPAFVPSPLEWDSDILGKR